MSKPVFLDKKSVHVGKNVMFGNNVKIYENNRIEGNTYIGDNVILYPNNFIVDSVIGENTTVNSSQINEAKVGKNCQIGPFSRIRPSSELKDNVHIGNFVEVKNSTVGDGTKACHLAYIGDSDIGKNCNVGCGAIFVNYNGKIKNRTKVGDNCFIGSNSNVIAPVIIEDNTYICAGTTVTVDTKNDDFVIGRVRQEIKPNRAHKYLKSSKIDKK